MVMVEIFVPVFDTEYDFKLDEYAQVNVIIDEIAEMVCRYEQRVLADSTEQFVLCDRDSKVVFDKSYNLHGYGIKNGARLMLV